MFASKHKRNNAAGSKTSLTPSVSHRNASLSPSPAHCGAERDSNSRTTCQRRLFCWPACLKLNCRSACVYCDTATHHASHANADPRVWNSGQSKQAPHCHFFTPHAPGVCPAACQAGDVSGRCRATYTAHSGMSPASSTCVCHLHVRERECVSYCMCVMKDGNQNIARELYRTRCRNLIAESSQKYFCCS